MNVFLDMLTKCPMPLPVSSIHQCDVCGVCSLLSIPLWPFLLPSINVPRGPCLEISWSGTIGWPGDSEGQHSYRIYAISSWDTQGPKFVFFFYPFLPLVARSGVWVLVDQKPVKRQVWWKVCFILDASNWSGGGQTPVQRWTLSLAPATPTDSQWTRAFIHRGRGLHIETVLTVILKFVSSDLTSVILIVLSTVSLQFQVSLFPVPWGQFLDSGSWCHGYSLVIM